MAQGPSDQGSATSDIRAVKFTPSRERDSPVLPDLLDQILEDEAIGTVTADGAYDTRRFHSAIIERDAVPIIPIRKNEWEWKEDCPAARSRDETLRATRHYGRAFWKRWIGYNARSRIEANMRCLKAFGERISARDPEQQTAEIQIRIAVTNRLRLFDTAEIVRVAWCQREKGRSRLRRDFCNNVAAVACVHLRCTQLGLDVYLWPTHIADMRIGPLTSLLATTYGLPERSVVLVTRAMREAGWLSSGARGVNAPEMTPTDMGRLSIALLTGEPPSKVVAEFEFIRGLQTKESYPEDSFVCRADLHEAHRFEDAVIALAMAAQDTDRVTRYSIPAVGRCFIDPTFSVSVDMSRRTALIEAPGVHADYIDCAGESELERLWADRPMILERWQRIAELESRSISSEMSSNVVASRGMRVVRTLTQREFYLVAEGMRGDPSSLGTKSNDCSNPD